MGWQDAPVVEDSPAWASAPEVSQQPTPPNFNAIEPPNWIEEKLARLPSFPQEVVNLAAGASEMGGLLRDAPRLQNVATEDGWRTAGRILDPTAAVVGMKGFQAAQQLPKLGAALEGISPLAARIRPMLDKVTGVATATPLRQSVVGGAGAGAAVGALQGEPLEGAAMGAAMGAAFRPLELLGAKAYELAANVKAGAEGQVVNYLNKVFPDNKQAVVDALGQLRALVKGEQPTAGLAATIDPERALLLKTLEEQARSRNPQAFIGRDIASQSARVSPLDEMAAPGQRYFDPDTGRVGLSEAEAFRKQVTDPLYTKANPQMVEIPPSLISALEGAQAAPVAARGERAIQQTAANVGGVPSMREATIPKGPDVLGMIPEGTPFMPQNPSRMVSDLQKIKNELSEKIKALDRATDAPSVTMRNNLVNVRRQLTSQMEGQSGQYKLATDIYRNLSQPQNQAEVAQVLRDALESPTGVERLSTFLAARKNAPQTIKRAGGDPRYSAIEEIMTPEQMQTIGGITRSVQREAEYAGLKAPREALPEFKNVWQSLEEMTPAFLKTVITAARKGLQTKGGKVATEADAILDAAAADPQLMMKLLNSVPPKDRNELANALFARVKQARGTVIGETVEQQ
mgnify:CR=1 FL=1